MYFNILQTISWEQNCHNIYTGIIINSIVVSVKTMKEFASRKNQVNSGYFKALLIGIQKIFKLLDTHEYFGDWILAFICSIKSNSVCPSLPPHPPHPNYFIPSSEFSQ